MDDMSIVYDLAGRGGQGELIVLLILFARGGCFREVEVLECLDGHRFILKRDSG